MDGQCREFECHSVHIHLSATLFVRTPAHLHCQTHPPKSRVCDDARSERDSETAVCRSPDVSACSSNLPRLAAETVTTVPSSPTAASTEAKSLQPVVLQHLSVLSAIRTGPFIWVLRFLREIVHRIQLRMVITRRERESLPHGKAASSCGAPLCTNWPHFRQMLPQNLARPV